MLIKTLCSIPDLACHEQYTLWGNKLVRDDVPVPMTVTQLLPSQKAWTDFADMSHEKSSTWLIHFVHFSY